MAMMLILEGGCRLLEGMNEKLCRWFLPRLSPRNELHRFVYRLLVLMVFYEMLLDRIRVQEFYHSSHRMMRRTLGYCKDKRHGGPAMVHQVFS